MSCQETKKYESFFCAHNMIQECGLRIFFKTAVCVCVCVCDGGGVLTLHKYNCFTAGASPSSLVGGGERVAVNSFSKRHHVPGLN